ncbi:MAG: hypothetical protein RSH52_26995, partial [Janthinobacterium sp.]
MGDMTMEDTGAAPGTRAEDERAGGRPRQAKGTVSRRVPRNGSVQHLKKQCRQLQLQVAQLEAQLKRQSADTCGLQALYDQLVNEIKHHRDMLQLDSFDAGKSAAVYTRAWRDFMAGDAHDFQTHRHLNSG